MKLVLNTILAAGIAFAGCGGGSSGAPTEANTDQAKLTTSSAVNLSSAFQSANGSSVSGAVQSLSAAAQGSIQAQQPETGFILDAIRSAEAQAAARAAGDCICDASGCVFDQCGQGSGYEVSGTITYGNDTYAIELTMTGDYGGTTYDYTYTGEITITETLIDGTFHSEGTSSFDLSQYGQSGAYDYEYSTDVTFNSIGLDGGCATSGSMDVSVDYHVEGDNIPEGHGDFSGSANIEFGPTCGDATAT